MKTTVNKTTLKEAMKKAIRKKDTSLMRESIEEMGTSTHRGVLKGIVKAIETNYDVAHATDDSCMDEQTHALVESTDYLWETLSNLVKIMEDKNII